MTEELLFKYISDQTNDEEEQQVRRWMSESELNRKELLLLKNNWVLSGLGNDIDSEMKEQEIKKILEKIRLLNLKRKRKLRSTKLVRYAAVFLLLIGLSCTFGYFFSTSQIELFPEYTELIVPKGERSSLILSDGTSVQLNSGSKLKFKPFSQAGKRRVILEGEAYFQVTHDNAKPFIVETGKLEVEVLGTSFNVSSYADDQNVTTYLESGRVKINLKNQQDIFLEPLQLVEYNKLTGEVVKTSASDHYLTDWTKGTLSIKGKTIKELSKILERRYNVNISFGDDKVMDFMYTGSIKDENLKVVLEALKFASSLNYEINGQNITLYSN